MHTLIKNCARSYLVSGQSSYVKLVQVQGLDKSTVYPAPNPMVALAPGHLLGPPGTKVKQSSLWFGLVALSLSHDKGDEDTDGYFNQNSLKTTNLLIYPLQFACHSGKGTNRHLRWTDTSAFNYRITSSRKKKKKPPPLSPE